MRHAGREGGKGESGADGSGAAVSARIRTAVPGSEDGRRRERGRCSGGT